MVSWCLLLLGLAHDLLTTTLLLASYSFQSIDLSDARCCTSPQDRAEHQAMAELNHHHNPSDSACGVWPTEAPHRQSQRS